MSTDSNKFTPEELLKIINEAKTDEEIIKVIRSENADDNILEKAFSSDIVNEGTLKKIIELEDLNHYPLLRWVIKHPKADSIILDLAYDKAKELHEKEKKDNNDVYLYSGLYFSEIKQILFNILGCIINSQNQNLVVLEANKKASPELLIKIINDTKDLVYGAENDIIYRVTIHPNANSDVLNKAYEKIKELGDGMSCDEFQLTLKRYIFDNKNTSPELLIKIINNTDDINVIRKAINHLNADSDVFEAAYDRTKFLCDDGRLSINNFLDFIDYTLLNEENMDKISKRLLLKIVSYSIKIDDVLGNLGNACSHKDISGEEVLIILKKIKTYDNECMLSDFYAKFPYLAALDDYAAEDFEVIDYNAVFNTQIAKDVAVLYFKANPKNFSPQALEKFSRECGVQINFETSENQKVEGIHR